MVDRLDREARRVGVTRQSITNPTLECAIPSLSGVAVDVLESPFAEVIGNDVLCANHATKHAWCGFTKTYLARYQLINKGW